MKPHKSNHRFDLYIFTLQRSLLSLTYREVVISHQLALFLCFHEMHRTPDIKASIQMQILFFSFMDVCMFWSHQKWQDQLVNIQMWLAFRSLKHRQQFAIGCYQVMLDMFLQKYCHIDHVVMLTFPHSPAAMYGRQSVLLQPLLVAGLAPQQALSPGLLQAPVDRSCLQQTFRT